VRRPPSSGVIKREPFNLTQSIGRITVTVEKDGHDTMARGVHTSPGEPTMDLLVDVERGRRPLRNEHDRDSRGVLRGSNRRWPDGTRIEAEMIKKDARAALHQLPVKLIGRRALRPRVSDEEVPAAVAHPPTITPHKVKL
jgi:hypothetical protein